MLNINESSGKWYIYDYLRVNSNFKEDYMFRDDLKKEMQSLIEKVPIIYKYVDFDGGTKILQNSNLLIKNPSKFNDPYDCHPSLIKFDNMPDTYIKELINKHYSHLSRHERRSKIANTIKESKQELINLFKTEYINNERELKGITCFSEDNLNLLMWSLYAESHKGICIGFNLEKLYRSIKRNGFSEVALMRVVYVQELEPINFFDDSFKAVINWLRTKSNLWKHEKEIRISFGPYNTNNKDHDYVLFDIDSIEAIYFGSKMQDEEKEKLLNLIMTKNINCKTYNVFLNDRMFKLETEEIKRC
jgi:hypothetical protein